MDSKLTKLKLSLYWARELKKIYVGMYDYELAAQMRAVEKDTIEKIEKLENNEL